MKILFIVNAYDRGGLFWATHNRIKTLKEKFNTDIEVYTLVKNTNLNKINYLKNIFKLKEDELKKECFIYESVKYNLVYYKEGLLKKIQRILGKDFYLARIAKEIDYKNIDVISSHWGHPQGSLAYHVSKKAQIPFTITFHGSDIHTIPKKRKGIKKIVSRNLQNSSTNLFVSEQLRNEAKSIFGEQNVGKSFITYNALDKNKFFSINSQSKDKLKQQYEINNNNDVVGYVGKINNNKRSDKLLEIFHEIQSNYDKKITFLIIGDGSLKETILKFIPKYELDVRYVGEIDQNELFKYYNMMDCLILPSKNEGLGNVIMEAYACNTQVVATNTGGIPEVIGDKRLLIENDDNTFVNDMACKVKKVLNSSEVYYMPNIMSWEQIVNLEHEIFTNLMNSDIK